MGQFKRISRDMRGNFVYCPNGRKLSDGVAVCRAHYGCILHAGEPVTVDSLWFRNAYPCDPLILAYVRGHLTGEYTHVPVGELLEGVAS